MFLVCAASSASAISPSGLNNQGAALFYDLETNTGITITDLRFWNLTDMSPQQVLPSGGLVTTGALISFGYLDGLVKSVLLFNAPSRAAGGAEHPQMTVAHGQRLVRGHFVGVWDARGKNLAPQGASEVEMDTRTGEVLRVK